MKRCKHQVEAPIPNVLLVISFFLIIMMPFRSISQTNSKLEKNDTDERKKDETKTVIAKPFKYKIYFTKDTINATRNKDSDVIVPIELDSEFDGDIPEGYHIKMNVLSNRTTLPFNSYSVSFPQQPLKQFLGNKTKMFLTLNRDPLEDRTRVIQIEIQVLNEKGVLDAANESPNKTVTINISEHKINNPLVQYKYLAYIGTNFDLVDGVQAKDLFFATNIYIPPTIKKNAGVGYYLSLYGNRTMSSTDSVPELRRNTRMFAVNDTTVRTYHQQMSLKKVIYSDNLGAFCSPLVRIWGGKDNDIKLRIYGAPSLEFVWRRTHIQYEYTNARNMDSTTVPGKMTGAMDFSDRYNASYSSFNFNAGLGVMLVHETDDISVRVHASVGWTRIYNPVSGEVNTDGSPLRGVFSKNDDQFFTGRAWITEAKTGLTLQAEVTNTSENPKPYYGVTLSKALDFKNLGSIFRPLGR